MYFVYNNCSNSIIYFYFPQFSFSISITFYEDTILMVLNNTFVPCTRFSYDKGYAVLNNYWKNIADVDRKQFFGILEISR